MSGTHCQHISVHVAKSGNVDLLRWLKQQHNVELLPQAMLYAAVRGQLPMCQYLRSEQCPWYLYYSVTNAAALSGSLETLRWLYDSGCPHDAIEDSGGAGRSGSIQIMEYVMQRAEGDAAQMLAAMLDGAGEGDQVAAAKWARARGAEWPDELNWRCAAIAWAREEGCTSPIAHG
jgi:hypothetical protein